MDGTHRAKQVCRARLISQARRSPGLHLPWTPGALSCVDLGALSAVSLRRQRRPKKRRQDAGATKAARLALGGWLNRAKNVRRARYIVPLRKPGPARAGRALMGGS